MSDTPEEPLELFAVWDDDTKVWLSGGYPMKPGEQPLPRNMYASRVNANTYIRMAKRSAEAYQRRHGVVPPFYEHTLHKLVVRRFQVIPDPWP